MRWKPAAPNKLGRRPPGRRPVDHHRQPGNVPDRCQELMQIKRKTNDLEAQRHIDLG